MVKLTFTNEIKQKMQTTYDSYDKKTFNAIYKGIMEPVDASSYKNYESSKAKNLYLEDLEWDLMDKKDFLEWLLNLSDRKRVIDLLADDTKKAAQSVSMLTTDSLSRLLILNNYFINHTSENNVKSVRDIIDYLGKFGKSKLKASQATLYRDLKQLEKLTGCINYHKKNKIPYEVSEGEWEVCNESGYYYTDDAKNSAINFNNKLPVPITEEQMAALKRLKEAAQTSSDNECAADLQILSDLVDLFIPQ